MIKVQQLSKSFGKLRVLKDLNLEIDKGGIFAILGPNGSGKTTLMKALLGMVRPDNGSILIDNQNISSSWMYREEIDYMPQIANFPPNLKVSELFKLLESIRKSKSDCQELIETFGIQEHLNKKFATLSGGTKQKVNIIASLMFDSPLVILDEPTTGLDPIAMLALKKLIFDLKKEGKTIVLSSHIISFVEEVADEIIFILDGKIYFHGKPGILFDQTNSNNLEEAIASILKTE